MRWSVEEINLLKHTYGTKPVKELVQLFPSRTVNSLTQKAKSLGLCDKHEPFSANELAILKRWGSTASRSELHMMLPQREPEVIMWKLRAMGISRDKAYRSPNRGRDWSEDEVRILKDNYKWYPMSVLELMIPKKTAKAIIYKAELMGLKAEGKKYY